MTTKKTLILAMMLLTAGALATSCSSEDSITDGPLAQQPADTEITLTATLAPKGDGGGQTRAITKGKDANKKEILNVTWAKDEEIAVRYQTGETSYETTTATVESVNADGSAVIKAKLTGAYSAGGNITFVYPASLANDEADDIDEQKLLNNQSGELRHMGNGTDNSISKNFDAATGSGTFSVSDNDATIDGKITMQNRVCICKLSLTFDDGEVHSSNDAPVIGGSQLNISIGKSQFYTITSNMLADAQPSQGDPVYRPFCSGDDIYVAMLPFTSKDIVFTSQYNGKTFVSQKTGSLEAGKFYRSIPVVLNIFTSPSTISGNISSTVTILDGGILTLGDANISVTSGPAIKCEGNATIILMGSNSATISYGSAPAIFVPAGKTLTIQGSGSLTASGGSSGAGIGGGHTDICGNIVIESGTVIATGGVRAAGIGSGEKGSCGTITVKGGTIKATGGEYAAGIGSGYNGSCGDITINENIAITAAGGEYAAGIGSGYEGSCGDITISIGPLSTFAITSGNGADGIGSGKDGSCGTVKRNFD